MWEQGAVGVHIVGTSTAARENMHREHRMGAKSSLGI